MVPVWSGSPDAMAAADQRGDGASRARTGDLLGAICPDSRKRARLRHRWV